MASTVIAIVPANVHQRCPPRRSKEGTSLCDTLTGLGGQSNSRKIKNFKSEVNFSFSLLNTSNFVLSPMECRICRGGTEVGELFHPCKCSGSVRWVHAEWYVMKPLHLFFNEYISTTPEYISFYILSFLFPLCSSLQHRRATPSQSYMYTVIR